MRAKVLRSVGLLGLTLVSAWMFTASLRSQGHDDDDSIWGRIRGCFESEHHKHELSTPVKLIGAIAPPQANFAGYDIGFVDPATERYYVAEGGPNSTPPNTPTPGSGAVDVLDAENDLVVGRITGFYGRFHPGCPGPNGMGPSGLLVTPDNRLVVADITPGGNPGTGIVKVFDMNAAVPPFGALVPAATISTGGTCRADEMAYDPKHHIVLVGNPTDSPTPSASFISLDSYASLGKITFPGSGGVEQPVWDSELHGGRFLLNVPGIGIVVINPLTHAIDTTYPLTNCNGTGLALGPFQNLLVGCSAPGPLQIVNALNGHLISLIPEIPSADEVWYNPGDGRFYAPSGASEKLGVIDAETNTFLQNVTGRTGMRSVAAFGENNHVFVIWPPPSLPPQSNPDALLDPCNTMFNLPAKTGCIAVYTHENEESEEHHHDH